MRIRLGSGLILLNLLCWLLLGTILLFPSSILRVILGIPFLLFFPGFSLMAALFPDKGRPGNIERVAISFGLSIAIVPLIGLLLSYTPYGIRLQPVIFSMAAFILITSVVAWLRQTHLTKEEQPVLELKLSSPVAGKNRLDKVLTVVLVIVALGTFSILGYVLTQPKPGETFTEFYILDQEGQAADYPLELSVGEEGQITVGIINHEGKETDYRVEISVRQRKIAEAGPINLLDEEKWQGEMSFVLDVVGPEQKIEIMLYKDSSIEPYLGPLRLWLHVSE